jgi:hypothetical protein
MTLLKVLPLLLLTAFLRSQDSGSPISLVDPPNGFVAGSDRDLLVEALLSPDFFGLFDNENFLGYE